jgi:hypothetical protein
LSLSVTRTYSDANTLTEAQLDAAFDSIETFLNTTKIDSTNIQTGGIATANYAALSVDAAAIAASAVTTSKINDLAVTTGKIAAGAVTRAKLDSVGQQISSSSTSTFSTTSQSVVDVTNATLSITTTGRPVWVGLQPGDSSNVGKIKISGAANSNAIFLIKRDSTTILQTELTSAASGVEIPPGAIWFLDVPSAGTYTYKLQVQTGDASYTVEVSHCKLVAFEL